MVSAAISIGRAWLPQSGSMCFVKQQFFTSMLLTLSLIHDLRAPCPLLLGLTPSCDSLQSWMVAC